MIKRVLSLTLFSALAASHTAVSAPSRVADAIYFGGDIVTVDDARPKAEALAVKDGKILAVGPLQEVTARAKGEATRLVDLKGKALLPGFIDPHSHFINGLAMEDQANVTAPPVGDASNAADIARNLKAFAARKGKKPGELIIGYGYDDNMLPPDHPLTRDDLDPAFPDNPVIVIHVSTHGAVLNSAALKQFNITAATPTPAGGVIARKPGSDEPTGLLMETAWLPLHEQLPAPTRDQEAEQIKYAQALYARAGVTTAQEGASMAQHVELLQRAARAGGLYIDLISYPFVGDLEAVLRNNPPERFGAYENRFKLGGCKILADGSPQGRTAAFTTPYLTGGPGGEKDWRGELTFPQETLNAMFRACYDRGLQVTAHANGDAGIDAVLRAHEAAAPDSLDRDRRTVVIHSQFVRKDQLEKFVAYRMNPSFFTEHTFFFGDAL